MGTPGKKFSFTRFMSSAIPNFARDDANDVNLSPKQADNLLAYQLALLHPRYLDEKSFFEAGIAGSESVSKKVYKSLMKSKIILPVPEAGAGSGSAGEQMTVNTAGITSKFASQMAVISVHAQRKLVGMLFFWEEECTRWKLLDQEEKEILNELEANDGNQDLTVALEAVEVKKKLLPR